MNNPSFNSSYPFIIHPSPDIHSLMDLANYKDGHGLRYKLQWTAISDPSPSKLRAT